MTDNNTQPTKLPPTLFAQTIAETLASRSFAGKTETVSLSEAKTGDLKGQFVCDELTMPRDHDETQDQFLARLFTLAVGVKKLCIALNDQFLVENELREPAVREALERLRNPDAREQRERDESEER